MLPSTALLPSDMYLRSLTRFVNHMVAGKAPAAVAAVFNGAPLIALTKKADHSARLPSARLYAAWCPSAAAPAWPTRPATCSGTTKSASPRLGASRRPYTPSGAV
jgi:hypothetical protein